MVGTGKLLAAGQVTSCCPAYITGRRLSSTPLESDFLKREDVVKKKNKKSCGTLCAVCRNRVGGRAYTTIIYDVNIRRLQRGERSQSRSRGVPKRFRAVHHARCAGIVLEVAYIRRLRHGERSQSGSRAVPKRFRAVGLHRERCAEFA